MLNVIWAFLIVSGIAACLFRTVFLGETDAPGKMVSALFASGTASMEILVGLCGMMCFWLGVSRIMESTGLTEALARRLRPLFHVIMPGVPDGHPALGSVTMNLAANMLGLDNAATPLGIRAMKELETLNPRKGVATDAEIMFLVINTSAVTIFPVSVILYRTKFGAAMPTDVFLPILIATTCSTLVGFLAVAFCQRLSLLRAPLLAFFAALVGLGAGVACWAAYAGANLASQATAVSNGLLLAFIAGVILYGAWKKQSVYDSFIAGAKEGFSVTFSILPYLVAMLAAIAVFRASGLLDLVLDGFRWAFAAAGCDTTFVDALPVAAVKPLSGSGARGMMLSVFQQFGPDSLQGRIASIMQGSTETTFYVLAVYFGAVGITRVRHAVWCGLAADLASCVAAILVGYLFFG
ncbi:MAG: spore maturation protein [Sutterellaceae bacterium]|nr:spore maturation protein [Sutterellaceae bacterium]MDD7441501.1 nucleoside recognition domain-containing protein [Sutterellaceae bacterium]MDY2869095.1 nucleoside recognition domain-containing protein [Mesosutterella sp.]